MSESVRGGPLDGDRRRDAPLESVAVLGAPSVDGGAAPEGSFPVGELLAEVPSVAMSTLPDLVPALERPRDGMDGQGPSWCSGSPAGTRAYFPDPSPYGYESVSSAPSDSRGGVCWSAHSHSL